MPRLLFRLLAPLAALACGPASARAADAPDFNRDVRPILAARCFKCHGPDEAARKAKLRLDTRAGAEAVLGKPTDSELLRRVFSDEPGEVMPPPATKLTLTAKEKETLRAWVAAGARYKAHWSFIPPKRPPVPKLKAQPANPIDAFVRAKLQTEGLRPSPEADRHTLVRRVYLDLIGIPPTPEEVDAFLNDKSAGAYERLVDRLLASPQYGERWARKWLDLARYADTNGYEKDRTRSVWPYRDWVIRALNADMPFDQFTVEQLAGDMLPNATPSQKVATGFHRNTMLNEEGGIDPLEFRYYAVVDRTAVTGTVWLGLTVGCAQCHTHKFDPVTHADYFRLFAYLNNAEEPEIAVPSPGQSRQRAEIEAKIRKLEAALAEKLPAKKRDAAFDAWLAAERKRALKWVTVTPSRTEAGPTKLHLQPDGSLFATGDARKRDLYTLTFDDLPAGVTAFRVEAMPDDRLPGRGPGRCYYEGPKGDFLLSEFTLTTGARRVKVAGASETHTRGKLTAPMALDGHPHTGWGGSGKEGVGAFAVFDLAEPLGAKVATLDLLFERHYSASIGRFRVSVTTAENAKARDIPAEVEELLAKPAGALTAADRDALIRHWLAVAPELRAARDEIETLRKQLPVPPTTLVMQERSADHPRRTFRHHRGEFLQPKEEVAPGLPALFAAHKEQGADAPRSPRTRLEFARWLVSRDNPLSARVAVNRAWHAFFGRGIVRTLDDFGYQGEPPTHPELLDWLACEFMDPSPASGGRKPPEWSVKHIHRLIVTSATYKQSSVVTPGLLAKDADNRLLARGPRVRLEAEQIRDSALKAAGLLSAKMYGPSVFPPQPPGVTTEGAYRKFDWQVSAGEDRYRRGLYTFARRTTPYAMAGTFDAPSGEACTARREVSNSALQALTMLNDAVLVEAAQALARRAAAHDGEAAARVAYLFRLCLVRPPTADEAAALGKFFEAQRERFAKDPQRAATAAGATLNAAEMAAWAATARAILNLDEFITKE